MWYPEPLCPPGVISHLTHRELTPKRVKVLSEGDPLLLGIWVQKVC